MENVSVKRKKHKKSLHEILTPKEETKCSIFVNRDVNACKNILLHRPKRKMRQNAVITYIFYNYVSSNSLNVLL